MAISLKYSQITMCMSISPHSSILIDTYDEFLLGELFRQFTY